MDATQKTVLQWVMGRHMVTDYQLRETAAKARLVTGGLFQKQCIKSELS